MKITIEHNDRTVSVEDPDVVEFYQLYDLLRDAPLATGFHPDTVEERLPSD